jgi:hypothetical protein
MKPIFEQLVSEAEKLGDDVKIEPKNSILPLEEHIILR